MTESVGRRTVLKLGALGLISGRLSGCVHDEPEIAEAAETFGPPASLEDADWAEVQSQFMLDPGIAYMNNASLGMPPRQVVEAVTAGYEAISREPLHGKHDLQAAISDEVVPKLAAAFGVRPGEISLTRNATEALHLQTVGCLLPPDAEVLITTQEHPAGSRPWRFREGRGELRVRELFIPSPLPAPEQLIDLFESALTSDTKAIAFCHVTRGGHLYPVAELCEMARQHGLISLVDGAQAVGQFPINVSSLGCDAYSASLHKWMLGPVGTGFLYVPESSRDRVVTAFAPDATQAGPLLAPPGTADFPIRAALGAALDFVETIGMERVEDRCRYLSDYLKQELGHLPDVRLLSGERERSAPGSTIFEKEGLDAVEAVPLLERLASVHIDEHQRDGHNAIRVSTHVYNTRAEIDRLVDALRTL